MPIHPTLQHRFRVLSFLPVLAASAPLCGCEGELVFREAFNDAPLGSPPGVPAIGSATFSGSVSIVADPVDGDATDRWLKLARPAPLALSEYIGTFEHVIDRTATAAFVAYVPENAPIAQSTYFETPVVGSSAFSLLHIDLLPDGNIRINDSDIVGTYELGTVVGFLVSFDLAASPPVANILVRGGGEDASTTVPLENAIVGFGLGRIRYFAGFAGVNAPSGHFLVDEVAISDTEE